MIDKVADFYEMEYEALKGIIVLAPSWLDPLEAKSRWLDRALGVAYFVQTLNVPYSDINALYETYKEKIEAL